MTDETPAPPTTPALSDFAELPDAPPGEEEELLPTFAEQVAVQLGGWRGLLESSVPVIAFVAANLLTTLKPAIIIAVAVAVGIAVVRLFLKHSIRHAVNGLFGVGLGALIAWNTGEEKDFYAPGILITLGYAIALLCSVFVRQPLVGWIYSIVADGGKAHWRGNQRMLRAFAWLTIGWAAVYFAKAGLQSLLYWRDMTTALGVTRIVLGFPPYALLLAGTIYAVRRLNRETATTA